MATCTFGKEAGASNGSSGKRYLGDQLAARQRRPHRVVVDEAEADVFRFAARLQLDATGSAKNSSSTGVGGQHVHLLLHGKEETANLVAG